MKKYAKYMLLSFAILLACIVLLVVSMRFVFWDFFNIWDFSDLNTRNIFSDFTHDIEHFYYIYDENIILGKTPDEIKSYFGNNVDYCESRYRMDKDGNYTSEYYSFGIILFEHWNPTMVKYMNIQFDENQKAIGIEFREGLVGG